MKWIGQHIYDLVSRFRNDVYLEDISTGTIASGAHLGLDSNNKIVKATDGGGDLTGITAGTGLSGTDLTGPVPTLNVDASQTQITGIGTITTGVWNGAVIASAYLDSDTAHLTTTQTFDGIKSFAQIMSAVFDGDKDVDPGDGAVIHVDTHDVTDSSTSGSGTAAMFTHVNIENPRLLATNSSVTTTAAATLYVKGAPFASTNQTITNAYALWVDDGLVKFDGALTVGGTITGNVEGALTGNADTVTTNANLTGHVTSSGNATTLAATQPTIDSIGTDGDTLSILGDILQMKNVTANAPVVALYNNNDATDGPGLGLYNERRSGSALAGAIQAGVDGDTCGNIRFLSYNDAGSPGLTNFAQIIGKIADATDGQEAGALELQVAEYDGTLTTGLKLDGDTDANGEIDVTIGAGAASVVTIPGDIDLAGDIDVDGTLETDALTVGGVAFTPSTTKHVTHHTIKDDIGTSVVYISLGEIDAESGTKSNKNLPILAPVAGKLLKVFLRTGEDMSGSGHNTNLTWRLLTRTTSSTTVGNAAVIGTQTGAGPTASSMATYDFTTGLDSGTNAIAAGDKVQLSVQSDAASADGLYFITCLWEWDFS